MTTIAACAVAACTALGPEGRGGWSPERRRDELARAAATLEPSVARSGAEEPAPSLMPRRIDLATALELAARHNRSIAASAASVDAAAGSVAIARAALLPTNTVRGGYQWFSDEQSNAVTIPSSIPGDPPVERSITVREKDFATVSAAMRLAIDLSGELRHGLYAAQATWRAQRARDWATRLDEETAVAAAYFGLLEAERLREVGHQTIALHERQFSDASSRFDQGRITRNGVLVVEVALTDARQILMLLENGVSASRRSLNRATGLAVAAATEAQEVAGRPDLPDLEDAVAQASTHNPLVIAMLEEVQAADERLVAARRSRFPRFHASAGYDATTADVLEPKDYGSAGVGVELDLGSFAREGEIHRLEAESRRSRLLLDRVARDIETLVRDSHDRVRERIAAIDSLSAAVDQAEENLRIRQVQFDEGRATSEDLLDASQLLARQRAALASALYQSHARRAELQQLTGQPLAALAAPTTSTGRSTSSPLPAPPDGEALR